MTKMANKKTIPNNPQDLTHCCHTNCLVLSSHLFESATNSSDKEDIPEYLEWTFQFGWRDSI